MEFQNATNVNRSTLMIILKEKLSNADGWRWNDQIERTRSQVRRILRMRTVQATCAMKVGGMRDFDFPALDIPLVAGSNSARSTMNTALPIRLTRSGA